MSKLSCSFTLGKVSSGNANIEHNNREFISSNVDVSRLADNIVYVREDVRKVYDELFGEALENYNAKQKRNDRKIHDYYEHILQGSREEAYYEIIVQFGDSDTAKVGTSDGRFAVEILDEYAKSFQQRNPNLRVINQIMHNDESSPHLHINFVPFYTQEKKIGMSKGVSMKSALIEQGFEPKGMKQNQLVMWEDSELKVMEDILNGRGIERDVKGATHAHKSVPQYKESKDWQKLPKRKKNLSTLEVYDENLRVAQTENSILKVENDRLTIERNSPYRSFYYSDVDKQNYVQSKLDELDVPYRESENGIESKACYVERIRKIEKQYTAKPKSHRTILSKKLDKIILQSNNFDEVLNKLNGEGYSIKRGKYIAVKPSNDDYDGGFIRLKSLGEDYTEMAIKRRILLHRNFVNEVNNKIDSLSQTHRDDSLEVMVQKNIRHYTVIFAKGFLPMKKVNKKKPFSWTNCEILDRLANLNKRINQGLTLNSLRSDFEAADMAVAKDAKLLERINSDITLADRIYKAGFDFFNYGSTNAEGKDLLKNFKITVDNYRKAPEVIAAVVGRIEKSLSTKREKLREVSDTLTLLEKIANGTYVDSIAKEEVQQQQSDFIGNGVKLADGSDSERVETAAKKMLRVEETVPQPPKPPKR